MHFSYITYSNETRAKIVFIINTHFDKITFMQSYMIIIMIYNLYSQSQSMFYLVSVYNRSSDQESKFII